MNKGAQISSNEKRTTLATPHTLISAFIDIQPSYNATKAKPTYAASPSHFKI